VREREGGREREQVFIERKKERERETEREKDRCEAAVLLQSHTQIAEAEPLQIQ